MKSNLASRDNLPIDCDCGNSGLIVRMRAKSYPQHSLDHTKGMHVRFEHGLLLGTLIGVLLAHTNDGA